MKNLHKIGKNLALLFFVLAANWSCKPELKNIDWDTDWTLPVAYGKLSIANLIGDTLVGNNGGSLFLKINQNLVQINGPELAKVKDTSLISIFSFPINLTFEPGLTYYNKTEKTKLNLSGAELTEAVVNSGKLIFTVNTTLKERSWVTMKMPCATKNGQMLMFSDWIEKSTGNLVTYTKEIDLAGYELNLKGTTGQTFNEVYYQITAQTEPNGQTVVFETTDQFVINARFVGLTPRYAKGFLGKQSFTVGPDKGTLPFFKKIKSGQLLLSDATAKIKITNYVGAEFKLKTNFLRSVNTRQPAAVDLSNTELIGPFININRAQRFSGGQWPPVNPIQKEFLLNNQNSNLKQFIEVLPDEIYYGLQLEANPFGNTSGGDDFIYFDKPFQALLELTIPLNFSAQALTLVDTLKMGIENLKNSNQIKEAYLGLSLENHFPLALTLHLFSVNPDGSIVSTAIAPEQTINAANNNTSANIEIYFKIPERDLRNILKNGKVLFYATLNSPAGQNTVLTNTQYLAYKHKLRVVYNIQTKKKND